MKFTGGWIVNLVIDFVIVTFLIYHLFLLVRGTRALQMFLGLMAIILLSVGADILSTVESISVRWRSLLRFIEIFSISVFTVEYALRLWVCVEDRAGRYDHPVRGRLRYALTPLSITDLVAILPFYLALLLPQNLMILRMFRLVRVLKLARYSQTLTRFQIVLLNQGRALLAALTVMLVLLIVSSGLMYTAEHEAQPDAFGSIPAAMWWAAVTMSTVGYGDVTPVTVPGKIIASFVAMLGIGMFALPTAVLGAGFMQEQQKSDLSKTAALVARTRIFDQLSPGQLAEIAGSLSIRRLPARYTIIRIGEHPISMYFIDEGEVVLRNERTRRILGPGDFFGEQSLLDGRTRESTIITLTPCQLLELRAEEFYHLIGNDRDLRSAVIEKARERNKDING